MSHDPDDEPIETQHERTFNFRGKPLAPYSYLYRAAFYRIGEGHRMPAFEEFTYLVFMLANKTPREMDALRSADSIATFREEAASWADRERVTEGKGWDELETLARSILQPVAEAESLMPAPTNKPSPPGNV